MNVYIKLSMRLMEHPTVRCIPIIKERTHTPDSREYTYN